MEARITRIPPNAIDGTWTLERRDGPDQPWIMDTTGDETNEDAEVLRRIAADQGLILIEDEEDTAVEVPRDDFQEPQ